ncbi:MAG: exodeoxyribonuclease VII small subunit [Bacteroidota bacterium]
MSKLNYNQALARLQEISTLLEGEIEDINELSALVKESAKLVKQCRKQLKETGSEIESTLDNLDEPLA